MANWEHNCRYVFMNSEDGSYQIVNETVPLLDYKTELEEVSINIVFEPYDYECDNPATIETREPDPHKYAVFISGMTEYRHWNDMSAMYTALKQVYGFMDENMIVLSYNGQEDPGHDDHNRYLDLDQDDNDDIYNGECNYDNVEWAFGWMADHLNTDDMLFVFVEDHGGTHDYVNDSYICLYNGEHLEDEDMADMVAPINCSEIIFVMEQCYSGGFQGELEGEHITFHSATDGAHSSWAWTGYYPSAGFDEFAYFWTTAARGCYPLSDDEPWEPGYALGNHPEYSYDFNPDDLAYGGNGDGFIQMEEAFEYADDMDLFSPYGHCVREREYPQNFTNIGFQEDLLSIYGICGNVSNTQTITGNFQIGPRLELNSNVVLTLDNNSGLYVNNGSTVVLNANAQIDGSYLENYINMGTNSILKLEGEYSEINLDYGEVNMGNNSELKMLGEGARVTCHDMTIDYGCDIVGAYKTTGIPETKEDGKSGIDGNVIECNNIICDGRYGGDRTIEFKASNDYTSWDGLSVDLLEIDYYARFYYCDFSGLYNLVITGTGEEYEDDRVVFENCEYFDNSGPLIIDDIGAGYGCAQPGYTLPIRIENTDFHDNSNSGLALYRILEADIWGCNFYNNYYGITIAYPPTGVSLHWIDIGSHFYNNMYGVLLYELLHDDGACTFFHGTVIENNFIGVYFGNNAYASGYNVEIKNNTCPEVMIYSNRGCDDLSSFLSNSLILDESYEPGTYDQWLFYCRKYDEEFNPIDISSVDWENSSDPTGRLYPFDEAYVIESEQEEGDRADSLYNSALVSIEEGDYQNAEDILKTIIENYSDSNIRTSISSLKKLKDINYYLYPDYENFRVYIVDITSNNDLINAEIKLALAASYLNDSRYDEAISEYEIILENPTTELDSVVAIINEGYCYLKSQQDSTQGKNEKCTFKPNTYNDYFAKLQEIYIGNDMTIPNPDYNEDNNYLYLYSNFPNPFRNSTNISFSLPPSTQKACLKIFNIKGQLVRELDLDTKSGIGNSIWDGKETYGREVTSGIYFYKLTADKNEIVKKMVLMR